MKSEGESFYLPEPSVIDEKVAKFGIGHSNENKIDLKEIPEKNREGLLNDYEALNEKIKNLLVILSRMLEHLNVGEKHQDILDDILSGLEQAFYRTANQILFHGIKNAAEASDAFDELEMLLIIVGQSIEKPRIVDKQIINEKTVYNLEPLFPDIEHREIESVQALFSPRNIAWNTVSVSSYNTKEPTKAGIRLDWGPLYVEKNDRIDKTKTQWRVSFDISGYNIDKVMNRYSLRGHHFSGVFKYKIGIIVPGLSKAMKRYYDQFIKE